MEPSPPAHFRFLVENTSELICIIDPDGTIRYQSPSVSRLLGYQPEELIGKNTLVITHPDDRMCMESFIRQTLTDGDAKPTVEYRALHRDGTTRILESVGSNCLSEPAIAGLVLNSRDLTRQKVLEEQLQQSQRLEAVGQLTGGVAHDFNNLLMPILVNTQLAIDDPAVPETVRTDLQEVIAAAHRAVALTRQLLAFSRKQTFEPELVCLNDIIRQIEKLLRRVIGEHIELRMTLQSEPSLVWGDWGRIEQLIMNLGVNSRDAMPAGGTLQIGSRDVERTHHAGTAGNRNGSGRWVVLSVVDTGCGMDENVKSRLFQPFFTTKDPGTGTGLGLATVYAIVKQHGGFVDVDSSPGRGSTFSIFFPAAKTPVSEDVGQEAFVAEEIREGQETILLVEDDPSVLQLTSRILESRGYSVLSAGRPSTAELIFAENADRIALLLTDVVMPGYSGAELLARLRRKSPALKVLLVSGYTETRLGAEILNLPGVAYLEKPFSAAVLARAVRKLLDA